MLRPAIADEAGMFESHRALVEKNSGGSIPLRRVRVKIVWHPSGRGSQRRERRVDEDLEELI
jgi:hypothetical protein